MLLTSESVDSVGVDVRWGPLGLCTLALCVPSDVKQGFLLRCRPG